MLYQNQEVTELRSETGRALIDPQGGRLLFWEIDGRRIIHWPENADWSQPNKIRGGNPILFPFIARHMVDGRIGFWKDSAGTLREMPMHGFGRDSLYELSHTENACILTLRDSEKTRIFYPYTFRFQISYSLLGKTLAATLETTNTGDQILPYYTGHHFYFAIPHGERADWEFAVDSVQQARQEADGSIIPQTSSLKPFLLSDPSLVDSFHLLSGQGPVLLRQRPTGRSLAIHLNHPGSLPWYCVTSWTQSDESDFYCLEPWLGLPNAIHHGQGLRKLAPGQTEKAVCLLDASLW